MFLLLLQRLPWGLNGLKETGGEGLEPRLFLRQTVPAGGEPRVNRAENHQNIKELQEHIYIIISLLQLLVLLLLLLHCHIKQLRVM